MLCEHGLFFDATESESRIPPFGFIAMISGMTAVEATGTHTVRVGLDVRLSARMT